MRNDHTGSYTLEQLQHIACGQQQCKPMCAFCCWWAGQGFSRIALVSIRSTLIARNTQNTQRHPAHLNTEYGYAIRNTQNTQRAAIRNTHLHPLLTFQYAIRNTQYAIPSTAACLIRNTKYAIRFRTHSSHLHVTQYAKCSHNTESPNTQRIKEGPPLLKGYCKF